jgi:hypothetical protein
MFLFTVKLKPFLMIYMSNKVSANILSKTGSFVVGLLDRDMTKKEIKTLIDFAYDNARYIEYKDDIELAAVLADAYVEYLKHNIGKTNRLAITREDFEVDRVSNINTSDNKTDNIVNDNNNDYDNNTAVNTSDSESTAIDHNTDTIYNLASFLGLNSFDKVITELNPSLKIKKAYMCLDTRYARFLNNKTKVQWDFINTISDEHHSTNMVGVVRDIVSIRMYSIVVPQFVSAQNRATVLIEEMSAQSFSLPNGRKFHFVGRLNNLKNPLAIDLRNAKVVECIFPDFTIYDKYEILPGYRFNEGIYRFNQPITTLNTITVSIADPFDLITFKQYEYKDVILTTEGDISCFPDAGSISIYYLPSEYIKYIYLDFPEPHGYTAIYSLFIDDLVSDNAFDNGDNLNEDDVVSYINTYEFTTIFVVSTTRIRITPSYNNLAGYHLGMTTGAFISHRLVPIGNLSTVRVRFNSYRVIMNFELDYLSK